MAPLVKPNIPLRRRLPLTFVIVLALFGLWVVLQVVGIYSPNSLRGGFLLAQQIAGWVFVIGVAVAGSLLLGMFISHRLLTHAGFTPFEEEMLRMRKDVQQQLAHTEKMREEVSLLRVEVARLKRKAREENEEPGADLHGKGASAAEAAAGASAGGGETGDGLDELGR